METNNNLIKKLDSNSDVTTKTWTLKKDSYADALTPTSNETYDHRAPFDHAKWVASLDPNGYCWSHGFQVQVGHNSEDCKGK